MATARGDFSGFPPLCFFFLSLSSSHSVLLQLLFTSSLLWFNCGFCMYRTPPPPTKQRAASRRRLLLQCVYPQISVNMTLWSLSLQCTAESLWADAQHLFVFTNSSEILFLSPHKIISENRRDAAPCWPHMISPQSCACKGWTAAENKGLACMMTLHRAICMSTWSAPWNNLPAANTNWI